MPRAAETCPEVHVIVGGLFEAASVGADLAVHLLPHHARAELLPSATAFRNVREEQPQRVQRQCFAHQMIVRGEIDREIIRQVATM